MHHLLTRARARLLRGVWSLVAVWLVASTILAPVGLRAEDAAQATDPRTFAETGYRVDHDPFWDFFQKRGSVRTFGYPVSGTFPFMGCTTQFFQRLILQQCGPGAGVGTLNLLDAGLLPYTRINGSTFPASDPTVTAQAPSPSDPDYAARVEEYVRRFAPDTFEGEPVRFFSTFMGTVRLEDAFPDGDGDAGLLPLLNLQLWGFPTSVPMRDPNNRNFIYQRFQRGIMHYDATCVCTQGLLLADYLKALLTGQNLPPDLAQQARSSPLYLAAISGRPPFGTDFAGAFTGVGPTAGGATPPGVAPGTPGGSPVIPGATPTLAPAATPTPVPTTVAVNQLAPSPDYGLSMFIWGHPSTTQRDLRLATDAGFRWQKTLFQWRLIEGRCKGCFDWTEADRVVRASNAAGVKIIARIDFQPGWTGVPENLNGPPLNYQDFWDFISAFVSRYRAGSSVGQVHAVEIWNEVNIDREWGMRRIDRAQAADYVRLLDGAYRVAKAADPSVVVVTAGLSPTGVTNGSAADDVQYLQWLYDAGMRGKFDVLGAHGNTQAPDADIPLNSHPNFPHPSFYFRRVEQLREVMVRNGDASKQIWLLEFGWTSDTVHPAYSWFAVSEEKKAQNVVRAYQFARQNWSPWIGVMVLWTMSDAFWTPQREEYWWAITNPDGSPRPAYNAIRQARQSGVLP